VSSSEVVIGVDAGGSNSRVACADLFGCLQAFVLAGGISPTHNTDGQTTLQSAIRQALTSAGRRPEDVRALVLGCAGIDDETALGWAREYTNVPGVNCPSLHLNDAEVAHAGAFSGQPGVIAVSGTGSIVWARTDRGEVVRNYDFAHYAHSAARHLAYNAVYGLLTESVSSQDEPLERATLHHFGAQDLDELQRRVQRCSQLDEKERNRAYGKLGPAVTLAAEQGSPIARAACDTALAELTTGIALVAGAFQTRPVPVVLVGSVLNAPYCSTRLHELLKARVAIRCTLREAQLAPVGGAVLLALRLAGVDPGSAVLQGFPSQLRPGRVASG